jgi:transposase
MRNQTVILANPEASRERLLAFARGIPGAYIGIKIAALLLTLEGQRPGWIAEILGLSRQSLTLWIHKVNRQGLESLKPEQRPGRPARLTPDVRRKLEKDLEKSPFELGLPRNQWDGPTLATYLKRNFGIKLKVRQAQYWMHQLGYRLKRSGYSYLQARTKDAKKFQTTLKKTQVVGA